MAQLCKLRDCGALVFLSCAVSFTYDRLEAHSAPEMPTKPIIPHVKARTTRELAKKAPKLVENTKACLLLKGNSTSQVVVDVLRDLVCWQRNLSEM
jgi:hypothetical protein